MNYKNQEMAVSCSQSPGTNIKNRKFQFDESIPSTKHELPDLRPGVLSVAQACSTMSVDTENIRIEVSHVINTFRDFPVRYAAADQAKKASILREMADAAVFSADGVAISWKKPFAFFMREEITPINKKDVSESSKTSTSAGNQGRLSNQVIDEIILELMIWIVEST